MSIDASNCTTGIYLITNTTDGKVYVGSAAQGFKKRWDSHRSLLRRGKHDNRHLQRAWDKYGEDVFVFSVVEFVVDVGLILQREQAWIDRYFPLGDGYCYNLSPTAGSNKGKVVSEETRRRQSESRKRRPPPTEETKQKIGAAHRGRKAKPETIAKRAKTYDGFVSPEGVVYAPVTNLKAFAREHGLSHPALIEMYNGKHSQVKGWTRIGCARPKTYAFRAPDGTLYENIRNVEAFAKEHGLSDGLLHAVLNGRRQHHKGWTKG